MKKIYLLLFFCILWYPGWIITGCKKGSLDDTKGSFTEEFKDVYTILQKGWIANDMTSPDPSAMWVQGFYGTDKSGQPYGFPAYSYSEDGDEYICTSASGLTNYQTVSSWLITPVFTVKNGDRLSFYTRTDTGSIYADRLEVLMNKSSDVNVGNSATTVGSFTTTLIDINPTQAVNAYPKTWTKMEYTFSGLTGKVLTRIAFRHFVPFDKAGKGVAIDKLVFVAQ